MFADRRYLSLVLVLLALTACDGDDSTRPKTQPLSLADAQSMIRAIAPQMQQRVVSLGGGTGSPTPNTSSCPLGGTVRALLGTGSGSANVVTIVHSDCRVDGPDGRIWTVNGAPNLRLTVGSVLLPTTPEGDLVITMTIAGTLQVAGGRVAGACQIDTKFEIRTRTSPKMSSTGRYTGKVCGQDVDETLTATAS